MWKGSPRRVAVWLACLLAILDPAPADARPAPWPLFPGRLDEGFYPISGPEWALVSADFDGDGRLDVAIGYGDEQAIALRFGAAQFPLGWGNLIDSGTSAEALASGDFDADGRPDLATVCYGAGSHVWVLRNLGLGAFAAPVSYSVAPDTRHLVADDFNADGFADLAVASGESNAVSVLLARGDGTFHPYTRQPVPGGPTELASADFDGDGWIDLAVAAPGAGESSLYVLFGQAAGGFQRVLQTAVHLLVAKLRAADVNGDGHPDLLTSSWPPYPLIHVLFFDPATRAFGAFQTIQFDASVHRFTTGDLDDDGWLDLVSSGWGSSPDLAFVAYGQPGGAFSEPLPVQASAGSQVAIGDYVGDGRADIVMAAGNSTQIFPNVGGSFPESARHALASSPYDLAAADLDRNGVPDLAVSMQSGVSVRYGDGDGAFGPEVHFPIGGPPAYMVVTDLTGDRYPDIAAAGSEGASWMANDGAGGFLQAVRIADGSGWTDIAAADFDRTGSSDLALSRGYAIFLYANDGAGSFEAAGFVGLGFSPRALITPDLDTDGAPDLVALDRSGHSFVVLHGRGDGTFETLDTYPVGENPLRLAAGDYTGDGYLDVLVANYGGGTVSVWRGRGDATLESAADIRLGSAGPRALVLADFDGDGRQDLATNRGWRSVAVFRGGNLEWPYAGSYGVGRGPRAIAAADFDDNGYDDLAVASYEDRSVTVLLSHPPCYHDGDVDGDGALTAGDARRAFLVALDLLQKPPVAVCAADCTGNGVVTAGDAQAIFAAALGLGGCLDALR